jgi:hypothetical protein
MKANQNRLIINTDLSLKFAFHGSIFTFQSTFVGGNIEITWNGTLEVHGLRIQVIEQNKFSSEYSVISPILKHNMIYKTMVLLVFLLPLLYDYET